MKTIWGVLVVLAGVVSCGDSDVGDDAAVALDGALDVFVADASGSDAGSDAGIDAGTAECSTNCDANATCVAMDGASSCQCNDGYVGDGTVCTAACASDACATAYPVLFGFRVEEGQPDRVYFDSSEAITATTVSGFAISHRTIDGIYVESGNTSGHYFTVSSNFTYWDNNTIRYEGNGSLPWTTAEPSDIADAYGNTVLDFTLTYIENHIPEPTSTGTNYFVATAADGGDDSNAGTSPDSPKLTIQAALDLASAGSVVYIKAGTYVTTDHTMLNGSGTIDNPIKIIGYRTNPTEDDITSNYYSFTPGELAPTLDPSEMPLIEGNDLAKYGLWVNDSDYVIIRNIQVHGFSRGITIYDGVGAVIDNCNSKDMYGAGEAEGGGLSIGSTGVDYTTPRGFRITNSVSINAGMVNFTVHGAGNLVEGCKTYNDSFYGRSDDLGSDYHITIHGSHSVVRNCTLENQDNAINFSSHAMSFRGDGSGKPMEYNLAEHLYIKTGSSESIQFRNAECRYNVARDSEIIGWGNGNARDGNGGIVFQTGARNNIYERITIRDVYSAIEFTAGTESGPLYENRQTSNNLVRNVFIRNVVNVLYTSMSNSLLRPAANENNTIRYITVDGAEYMARGTREDSSLWTFSNNVVSNSLFHNIGGEDARGDRYPLLEEQWAFDRINWSGTSYTTALGTNPHDYDPGFDADYMPSNAALNLGVDAPGYDFMGAQRRTDGTTTLGHIQMP